MRDLGGIPPSSNSIPPNSLIITLLQGKVDSWQITCFCFAWLNDCTNKIKKEIFFYTKKKSNLMILTFVKSTISNNTYLLFILQNQHT